MEEDVYFLFSYNLCQIQQLCLAVHLYDDFLLTPFQPFIVRDLCQFVFCWSRLELFESPQTRSRYTGSHFTQSKFYVHSCQKNHLVLLFDTLETLIVLILVFHLGVFLLRGV